MESAFAAALERQQIRREAEAARSSSRKRRTRGTTGDALPRLSGKQPGTWHVGRQTTYRPYDPTIDGWDVHKLRRREEYPAAIRSL